jgi:N-acetylglucosaminyl-diphospho-decaprenol L-rhamnosyltransferase
MTVHNELLTICMVSFYSDEIIKKTLKIIPINYQVLITDNAISENLKDDLESSFKNVKVITPSFNLGNGGGINFALNKINTKYALYLDVDTEFEKNTIDKLLQVAEVENDWVIIAPNLKDYTYRKNCYLQEPTLQNTSPMNFVEGCALLFSMSELSKVGFYDEKIFLYYEENDLYFRCLKNKKKILLCNNIFIKHFGNSSINNNFSIEIELNRNWHYMWSKFYYYKKNYSYTKGINETVYQFIKSILKLSFYYFLNKKKFMIYKNRFSGLYNSYLNKNSWRRPHIK